ncbi:MAG: electron transport complex subunit RsxA [Gammaproteobacteria bacterium]|nr:electron transport complex subunit RsxA [Gammaproteobacteria bacterium]
MGDLFSLWVGALLINNFVLVWFLGLCPFMGASTRLDNALAMGAATCFVLVLSAASSYLVYHCLLVPFGLTSFRIIAFILVVAFLVQLTELYVRHAHPLIHQTLGAYLPLVTSNCAVLGVALIALREQLGFIETLIYAFGAALGFWLVLLLFAAIRRQLEGADVPARFAGVPIALITAGFMSLAFMGFSGMGQ